MNLLCLFGCFLSALQLATSETAEDTLVLVHVVVRHGDRTADPTLSYPNDPHSDYTYMPYGPSRLTTVGVQNSYKVGRLLRKRYDLFLGPDYYYGQTEAISSMLPRCRTTMQAILSKLYEDSPLIPEYDYVPLKEDRILTNYVFCMDAITAESSNEEHVCEHNDEVVKLLSEHSGVNITYPQKMAAIHDTLKIQENIGLKLPNWVEPIWPEPLTKCSMNFYWALTDNKKSTTYLGGNLLHKILKDTELVLENKQLDRKMFIYVGHDTNIVTMLNILGQYNGQKIGYCEFLMYEVHRIDGVLGIKVYHERLQGSEPILYNIPKCGTFCPLDKFYDLAKEYFTEDWCMF